MNAIQEPKGIPFYSVKTGETHWCKLEPTIAAYINSSDMGINASRGQDYGWRLAPEWVKRVKAFKKDESKMSILISQNGGQRPNDVQILYYMYDRQLKQFYEAQEENEDPYEDEYRSMISDDPEGVEEDETEDLAEVIDQEIADKPAKPKQK